MSEIRADESSETSQRHPERASGGSEGEAVTGRSPTVVNARRRRNMAASATELPVMQDLLNAGLSRHLVIQSGDAESFLAATEALLVRESPPPSREVAESLWDEAAQRFFRAPPRAIWSRAAFVNHIVVQKTALPTGWSNVINTNPLWWGDHIDMATVLGRLWRARSTSGSLTMLRESHPSCGPPRCRQPRRRAASLAPL
eukprot:scaffold120673_cov118-Phaeocystis_antarctica.AAC.3